MEKKIPTKFIGEIEGNISQITPELSKGRLRIFYKGLNRNQGYITDELCGLKISFSFDSFYQIHSQQCEVLYKLAKIKLHLSPEETVLDTY